MQAQINYPMTAEWVILRPSRKLCCSFRHLSQRAASGCACRGGSSTSGRQWKPLGLCGQRLPELNLVSIRIIDPGKATVGFVHPFGVNLYALLF
jgi:hypothetical protein